MLDRDYNLLGKAPQEKIGRWFPQLYAITADSIYFWLNGKITHYIDTSDLSNLELLPMLVSGIGRSSKLDRSLVSI